jgi:hypothetical protein
MPACVCNSLAGSVPWVRRLDKLSFYVGNECTSSLENTVYFVRHLVSASGSGIENRLLMASCHTAVLTFC